MLLGRLYEQGSYYDDEWRPDLPGMCADGTALHVSRNEVNESFWAV